MRSNKSSKERAQMFVFSWRDCAITVVILSSFTLLSPLLEEIGGNDVYVPMLFVLAVFLVARYTTGYLFGMIASFAAVIIVNYIFTYPFFKFDFFMAGYPITFVSMLATSLMTSTMTTQIKKQEHIRAEAEKEIMRGNLLRAVSHDLRTPLTSILGSTSALLENGDKISEEKKRELIQEGHDDAEWLIRMVENLLSITRVSGEARIKKTPEAAEEIAGEAVRKFSKRFPDARVSVAVPSELLIVPMDAILIEQVIINLLENSIIHGKNNNGIAVVVEKSEDDAVFTVSDNGAGIPEKAFEHLFDGYLSSTERSVSETRQNMGIGLSVCMSIVKAHGGAITAENKPQGGARFRFSLPLKEN